MNSLSSTYLLNRYGPDTPLADIPWEELPPALQKACEGFIDAWWNSLDLDQPIEASGLAEMTLAEVGAVQKREEDARAHRRYRLVTFLRIEPEGDEPMTYEEALAEREQQELMCPENIYRIEEFPHP